MWVLLQWLLATPIGGGWTCPSHSIFISIQKFNVVGGLHHVGACMNGLSAHVNINHWLWRALTKSACYLVPQHMRHSHKLCSTDAGWKLLRCFWPFGKTKHHSLLNYVQLWPSRHGLHKTDPQWTPGSRCPWWLWWWPCGWSAVWPPRWSTAVALWGPAGR